MNNSALESLLEKFPQMLPSWLQSGLFGLEKEAVRCDLEGNLALTPHPEGLGNKGEHPYITTDFSESQIEIVTPPVESLEAAHGFLRTVQDIVIANLPDNEILWNQSMPPLLPENEQIPLARFDGQLQEKTAYREYLSTVYGPTRQMISGSHFNFSFSPKLIEAIAQESGDSIHAIKSDLYLRTVRNLMHHRWFLVGMLGRSPIADPSLRIKSLDTHEELPICCTHGVSIRSSNIGYRNKTPLDTDYCCVEGYAKDVSEHIESGHLLNPNELYLPVRLKFSEDTKNISHLEIRLLDLDPLDPSGLSIESLYLLHQYIVYCAIKDDSGKFELDQQRQADTLQHSVACRGFAPIEEAGILPQEQAQEILGDMRATFARYQIFSETQYTRTLENIDAICGDWALHPVNTIKEGVESSGFLQFHLALFKQQQDRAIESSYRFHGYTDLELSTQILLKEAIRRGVEFEFLDRSQNFVKLKKHGREDYVIQATKTSLDTYSHILAMENKVVTKKLLEAHGLKTPGGEHFTEYQQAKATWYSYKGKPTVIKPKSTNFGLGITILKENQRQEWFEHAIDHAFEHDDSILIEPFVSGKEYRFFVVNEQVVAILHRIPANIIGDGQSTIEELVAKKNSDPKRGTGYRTPLEKLQTGGAESQFLQTQGLDFQSIPENGQKVFLRENSNISTGGDSIDYTERVHPSYSKIASRAARALDVTITGLDMMIQDISQPATHGNYAIIEMNFNPAIHIHCYPHEGKNRRLEEHIMNLLGFV